jgi:hypothetical protein
VIRHYQVVFRTPPGKIWIDLIPVLEVNKLPNCVVFGIKIITGSSAFPSRKRIFGYIQVVDSLEKPQTIMFA